MESRTGASPSSSSVAERSARGLLGLNTIRLLLALLILFVFYRVLVGLSFVETLTIPDIPLSGIEIVRMLFYITTLGLLIGYAQSLGELWPRAFSRWAPLSTVLIALVYVAVLAAIYAAVSTPILRLSDDPDVTLLLQVILTILAILVLGAAWMSFYQTMPDWLSNLRFAIPVGISYDVACLNCGHLNPGTNRFCGNCGESRAGQTTRLLETEAD